MPRIAGPDGRPPLSTQPGATQHGRTPAKPPPPLDPRAIPRGSRNRGDRPSRWHLLLRRQRRLLRPLGWGLASLLVVGAVAVLARNVQPASTVASLRERLGAFAGLRVDQVVVEGRTSTPEPLLRAALGVSVGDKLLGFSLQAARSRIESLSWVQHATVERRLPGTIVVHLTERRPFAVWQNAGKFVLIDRTGQVVTDENPAKDALAFSTLPLVVGLGAPEHAAALLDLLTAQPTLRLRVTAVVRVGERRWNLHLTNGADVLLPEGAEAAALAKLVEMQDTQALLDRPLQTLDLRLPDRLVVRPQPPPSPVPSGPRRPT